MNRAETWQAFETALPPALTSNTLSFNARKPEWILYAGQKCETVGGWQAKVCHEEVRPPRVSLVLSRCADELIPKAPQTFYTKDTFSSSPQSLLAYTSRCLFAHEKKEFAATVPDELIFCAAYEPPSSSSGTATRSSATLKDAISSLLGGPPRALKESRLYSSTDWFQSDRHQFVDLGIGKEARGVVGIGGVQKYLVTALKPSAAQDAGSGDAGSGGGGGGGSSSSNGEMVMYVTEDGKTWSRAQFPHGHGLRENAYTIVESTEHSILVDVNSSPSAVAGTLFTSNSNGTYFVRSLENTNRNRMGIVDFEQIVGVEGVAIINTVMNVEAVEAGKEEKALKTKITFDDGASRFAGVLRLRRGNLCRELINCATRRSLEFDQGAGGRQRRSQSQV
jgi:hypothetical protein